MKLKKAKDATFQQRVSLSRSLIKTLFNTFDIHNGFLGDLLGRPDYWSAVGRFKEKGGKPDAAFGTSNFS